jgi:exosortase
MSSSASYKCFALLGAISLLLWRTSLLATLTLAVRNGGYTHILLIFPLSAMLLAMKWRKNAWEPAPALRLGSILLGSAALIGMAGLKCGSAELFTADVRLTIEMLALAAWCIGSFVICFGASIARQCAFPLLFLLWIVPLPGFVLSGLIEFLQKGTASFARDLFAIVGVPVTQVGTTLTIPGLSVEVAQECSSIRSSTIFLVTSMFTSYLLLHSLWGRTIAMLAAVPASIAKNGVRVFTLAALGAYVNPAILNGPLHHQGGVLFFAIAFSGEFLLIWILSRLERKDSRAFLQTRLSDLPASSIG